MFLLTNQEQYKANDRRNVSLSLEQTKTIPND